MIKIIGLLLMLMVVSAVEAEPVVYRQSVDRPLNTVYAKLYDALESRRLFVVFEPNIGKNLAGFAERWGEDYNRSALEGIRSMVFCNAWYANQVSNRDPHMLALCPLSVTLIHKAGTTTALFVRPTAAARGSPAEAVLREVEGEVIAAIEEALK